MNLKPDWKDAPKWAKHLWAQPQDNRFTWSATEQKYSKALWTTDKDNATNRYHLWPDCWEYVEARP